MWGPEENMESVLLFSLYVGPGALTQVSRCKHGKCLFLGVILPTSPVFLFFQGWILKRVKFTDVEYAVWQLNKYIYLWSTPQSYVEGFCCSSEFSFLRGRHCSSLYHCSLVSPLVDGILKYRANRGHLGCKCRWRKKRPKANFEEFQWPREPRGIHSVLRSAGLWENKSHIK